MPQSSPTNISVHADFPLVNNWLTPAPVNVSFGPTTSPKPSSQSSRDLYYRMALIRAVEEKIRSNYGDLDGIRCPVHLSIGQEAVAVGVCAVLQSQDRVFSTHRCHAHYLARGGDLKAMVDELHGRTTGCNGGRGGSMHLFDDSVGMMASVPIVGSAIGLAVGTALADKLDGNRRVTVAFFGDAAIEEGIFHESANLAAVKQLPVLFVCENNNYSINTPLKVRQPGRRISEVAASYRMPGFTVNGGNIETVHLQANNIVREIRGGRGPALMVCSVHRWAEHCGIKPTPGGYNVPGDPLRNSNLSMDDLHEIDDLVEAAFSHV